MVVGEGVVMCILVFGGVMFIDKMNLVLNNCVCLEEMIKKFYGIFFVVGLMGLGKIIMFYVILGYLNMFEKKIWIVEDLVEIM